MEKNINNWYVITGSPCSGKSTILKELQKMGFMVVEEVARTYINQEIAKGKTLEEIRKNEYLFQKKILTMKINLEKKLPKQKIIFFERGIPDSIAYFKLIGRDIKKERLLEKSLNQCFYKKVFLLQLLDYKKDYARVETKKQAQLLETLLQKSYAYVNIPLIKIPKLPIKERLKVILTHLK